MKRNFAWACVVLVCITAKAQKPEEKLASWAVKSPIEKAYLHFDRGNYIAGETAWFKAYLTSDFYPDTISTSLYVELVNDLSVVLDRKIVPAFWGAARGYISIPDSLITGNYTIRAYTATMLNQDEAFLFKRPFFIYGKKANAPSLVSAPNKTRLEFFPEGGNLVNGLMNAVAFKATDSKGFPVAVTGSLRNQKDQELASFSSYHDGMGMFEFIPVANEQYYVVLSSDLVNRNYLPAASDKGIVLAVETNPVQLAFDIQQPLTDPGMQAAYIVGQMQHRIVFRQSLAADKVQLKGIINTSKLNSGILQITVFNKDGIPMAERLCFIDNKEYVQKGELIIDTVSFSAKGRNHLSLQMKDTVHGSFSVSITDPLFDVLPVREHNIFSGLLLTSDIKGYVHNPAWYFTAIEDSARRAMDLVMMVNGWRRFKWEELAANNSTSDKYKDLSYIKLAGRANMLDSKRPFAGKELLIAIYNADSTSTMQLVNTDGKGYFKLDSMFFTGNNRLLFSDPRGNKSSYIEVTMSADSLSRSFPLKPMEKMLTLADPTSIEALRKFTNDYDEIQKASGLMMDGVTIKGTRKKTPAQEVEAKYTSALFAGIAEHVIDLVNTKEVIPQRNIFEYIQARIPGIDMVITPENRYMLFYRGRTSFRERVPMMFYLNEVRVDDVSISIIRASDISLIKVYSHFVGAEGNAPGGVLSVYTKKGEDVGKALPAGAFQVIYKGYSVNKEFYSPDYNVEIAERNKTDNRITLQWIADLNVGDINPDLPIIFYNNDRSKQFKVIIEGMTTNGKLLMIEKTISPKGF